MESVAPRVWTHVVAAEGFPTVSAVVLTERLAVVVDTLADPADMKDVLAFLDAEAGDRRRVVVNTHHHWDHVYGNAAFAGCDIVAQRACPRLLQAELQSGDESVRLPPAEGVPLPTITFGDRLAYHGDDATIHLLHTPGHSEDSLVVFVPESRVLIGGDTVEWPFPNFGQRDASDQWVKTLRSLKQLPVDLVVPAHGPAMGKEIIDADERYIEDVYAAVAAAKADGVLRGELELPAERFVLEGVEVDEVYRAAHAQNLLWAWDEV